MAARVFCNFGGNYQLRVEAIEDLGVVLELRDARWTATAAPIASFECDRATPP